MNFDVVNECPVVPTSHHDDVCCSSPTLPSSGGCAARSDHEITQENRRRVSGFIRDRTCHEVVLDSPDLVGRTVRAKTKILDPGTPLANESPKRTSLTNEFEALTGQMNCLLDRRSEVWRTDGYQMVSQGDPCVSIGMGGRHSAVGNKTTHGVTDQREIVDLYWPRPQDLVKKNRQIESVVGDGPP